MKDFLKWFFSSVFAVACLAVYVIANLDLILGNLGKVAIFVQLRSWMKKDDKDGK